MDRRDCLEQRGFAACHGVPVDTDALVPSVGVWSGRQDHGRVAEADGERPRAVGVVLEVSLLDGVRQIDGRVSFVGPFAA